MLKQRYHMTCLCVHIWEAEYRINPLGTSAIEEGGYSVPPGRTERTRKISPHRDTIPEPSSPQTVVIPITLSLQLCTRPRTLRSVTAQEPIPATASSKALVCGRRLLGLWVTFPPGGWMDVGVL
jgi:hypothetical protein